MAKVAGHGWPGKPKSRGFARWAWLNLLNYKRLPGGPPKAQLPGCRRGADTGMTPARTARYGRAPLKSPRPRHRRSTSRASLTVGRRCVHGVVAVALGMALVTRRGGRSTPGCALEMTPSRDLFGAARRTHPRQKSPRPRHSRSTSRAGLTVGRRCGPGVVAVRGYVLRELYKAPP